MNDCFEIGPVENPYRHDHNPLNADSHGGICSACGWENEQRDWCARCGSSTGWIDCWACASGFAYDEDEDTGEPILVACEWCAGNGGANVCLSSAEWCEANPLPGREEVERS